MNWPSQALTRIRTAGAEYGDIRVIMSTAQTVRGEDQRIASIREFQDSGFGVRVLFHGAWGFAASSIMSVEEIPRVVDLAVDIAKASATLINEPVRLAEEPVYRDSFKTAMKVDPFQISLEEKSTLLLHTMESLHQHSGDHSKPGPPLGPEGSEIILLNGRVSHSF